MIPTLPSPKDPDREKHLLEMIHRMALSGQGWEDIWVRLRHLGVPSAMIKSVVFPKVRQ